jgi:hypothetical protein
MKLVLKNHLIKVQENPKNGNHQHEITEHNGILRAENHLQRKREMAKSKSRSNREQGFSHAERGRNSYIFIWVAIQKENELSERREVEYGRERVREGETEKSSREIYKRKEYETERVREKEMKS